ncbi:MAG: A/G-specific adenine glycosylase [Phycisphaerae bacterium]|nr:A/G-specific adenine glycosylase [Phycisphaerae bacterium]
MPSRKKPGSTQKKLSKNGLAAAQRVVVISPSAVRAVRSRLLLWYGVEKRQLPWRECGDPYAIWLSETMLQQTQVATVIPYYRRFLNRYPTVRHLAAAPLDDVLELWAGLGYYARARNLHRAANAVVNEFGGSFPRTAEALQRLPGVGAYTAGAVASIAFGECSPVVDGNVSRVLSRLFGLFVDIQSTDGRRRLWETAGRLVAPKNPGDFNQALMELGATVCLPKQAARCDVCPLVRLCAAYKAGNVAQLPIKARKSAVVRETHAVAAIRSGQRWLFVKRPESGLWGGLWELPTQRNDANDEAVADSVTRLASEQLDGDSARAIFRTAARPFCDFTHQLTHRTIRFVGHVCTTSNTLRTQDTSRRRWMTLKQSARLGLSRGMRKIVELLRNSQETER